MNVSVGPKWEAFVAEAVESGRYGSVSEIVREGLRLVEEREAKLAAVRQMIDASIAEGGEYSSEDVRAAIEEAARDLERQGL